jgi:SAM-dependent methyltransferase
LTGFDAHERAMWASRAVAYRDTLAALCAGAGSSLLDAAGVGLGASVVDVGAGPGTVASLAAARGARVVAVDASPGMVALARSVVPSVVLGALPSLPLRRFAFDAAVANFVVNHVGDPLAAVGALRRIVRPGGRVAVTIWPHPAPPAQGLWSEIFAAAGVVRPLDLPRLAADKDFPRSAAGLGSLLSRSGLGGVDCAMISWTHRTSPQEWWNGAAEGIGAVGTLLTRQDPATVARVRKEFDRVTARFLEADGRLALPTAAVLGSGEVPGEG